MFVNYPICPPCGKFYSQKPGWTFRRIDDDKNLRDSRFSSRNLCLYHLNLRMLSRNAFVPKPYKSKQTPRQTLPESGRNRSKGTIKSHSHPAARWNSSEHLPHPSETRSFWSCRRWSWNIRHTRWSPRYHAFSYYGRLRNITNLPLSIKLAASPIDLQVSTKWSSATSQSFFNPNDPISFAKSQAFAEYDASIVK